MQIMCPVTDEDIQEHVRLRLEAEKKEKEERKKEKAEAHLYTVIRLVRDSDIAEQIGNGRWFDLANPDKVHCLCLIVITSSTSRAEALRPGSSHGIWKCSSLSNHVHLLSLCVLMSRS